jgi:hypothetical protein
LDDGEEKLHGLDAVLNSGSKVLRLCGHGKPLNWSVRVADYFFYNCPCCIFFRGLCIGMAIGAVGAAGIGYLGYIGGYYGL